MSAEESVDQIVLPVKLETTEPGRLLPDLQRVIVRSLMWDRDYLDEGIQDTKLDELLQQGEPYDEKITEVIRPKAFYGSVVSAHVLLSLVDYDKAQLLPLPAKSKYRCGMRMDVFALNTTSTARKQAGSFAASLLYATYGDSRPSSHRLPRELWAAKHDFPVKRRLIGVPTWDDGSAFQEHLEFLARNKGAEITGFRRPSASSGHIRRAPKHR